ncbi:MAG: metallophosphoesterase, partial [Thermoguttaceae bacterium]|nr:metallophosphoesterase [Thermoguttaceae bacterium]
MKKFVFGLSVFFVALFAAFTYGQECEHWILVTDPHIPTKETQGLNGRDVIGNFKTMTKEILALAPKPTGVIITGDIANHKGLESDYLMARRLFEPFEKAGIPLYPLLGNHDRRDPFFAVFPKWKTNSAVAGRHCFELQTKYADFYML